MLGHSLVRWYQRVVVHIRQQRGQGLVEYGLIIALVALLAVGAVSTFGSTMNDALYNDIIVRGLGS